MPKKKDTSKRPTWLFPWKPERWPLQELEHRIDEFKRDGRTTEEWSCKAHKETQNGDRFFVMGLGTQKPNGINGSGFITSLPYWGGDRYWIKLSFDAILHPKKDRLLELDILEQKGVLAKNNWTPQGQAEIKHGVDELEAIWFNHLNKQGFFSVNGQKYSEGTAMHIHTKRYERNPHARIACIKHYGYSCAVCGFNFANTYGDIGSDFIHIHHLQPLSKTEKTEVDPIEDLRPVCPNCHAMIHKRKPLNPPYTIEEMKEILEIVRIGVGK